MEYSSGPNDYHLWYYTEEIWRRTTFLGVPAVKSVCDMWNYQEILAELKPSLVLEFGTNAGGSALYFAEVLKLVAPRYRVLTVDIDQSRIAERVRKHPEIELLQAETTSAVVLERFRALRQEYPGPAFCILDSDHRKDHVISELIQIRPVTTAGDYVVVEDGNINGHPVLPDWGPGPFEAIREYQARFPADYRSDDARERKFGFTFAVNGFLVRL